jgi:hypothetical protein
VAAIFFDGTQSALMLGLCTFSTSVGGFAPVRTRSNRVKAAAQKP